MSRQRKENETYEQYRENLRNEQKAEKEQGIAQLWDSRTKGPYINPDRMKKKMGLK